MSSWSQVNNLSCRKVNFLWKGEVVGSLSSALAKFWQTPLMESTDFQEACADFQQQCMEAGYRWAIARLAEQNQSKKQLVQKMRMRGLEAQAIEGVIERLEKASLLDETFLAQSMEEKEARAHKSRRATEQKMSGKGLKISQMDHLAEKEQDVENAYYWLKRWAKNQDLRERPDRYMARLAGRGFDFSSSQEAWQRWMNEFSDVNSK